MSWAIHLSYCFSRFLRTGGPGLLTTSRVNDYSEAVPLVARLFYIAVAWSSRAEEPKTVRPFLIP